MKIEGAIFDLDGTLLDSMFIWENVGEEYLKSRGIEPRDNLKENFKNKSLYQAACYFQSDYGLTDSTDEIINGVNKMIENLYTKMVIPKEGVKEFLEKLHKRNVKMCVATATDHHLVKAALSRCELLKYFGEIFTCTLVGSGKDRPHIYNTALDFLKTPKNTTWIFEDALYAVKTAKSAGFNVAGVYDKFEGNTSLVKDLSDIYITSFKEAEKFL